jgi:hypothetical protein
MKEGYGAAEPEAVPLGHTQSDTSKGRRLQRQTEPPGQLLAAEPEATPERRAELELAAHKAHRAARYYADLTFSPTKSWSVLHAAPEHAGRQDEAAAVWDAWETGVHAGRPLRSGL